MIRRVAVAAGSGLGLFHVWLLVGQAWQGELVEPGLLLRWLVAGALVVGLAGLRRSGAPVFWSRRTVALCLLGALLHGPAVIDRVGADATGLPETAAIVVEVAAASAVFGVALLLVAALFRRTPRVSQAGESHTHDRGPAIFQSLGFVQAFAPRPPPIL